MTGHAGLASNCWRCCFHIGFTLQDFALIVIIEFDGRLQPKQVLGPVVSFHGFDDLFGGCLDLRRFIGPA
jgi:hypothetical protein